MIGETVPLRSRVFHAVVTLVLNLVVWVAVPSLISSFLSQGLPNLPLANLQFIYTFGAVITILQVAGALTKGMAISVPFVSGGYVASAFYIWEALDGGTVSFSAAGLAVTLTLQTLLFLLLLPSLFGAVKAPLDFLLERSEVAREAMDIG